MIKISLFLFPSSLSFSLSSLRARGEFFPFVARLVRADPSIAADISRGTLSSEAPYFYTKSDRAVKRAKRKDTEREREREREGEMIREQARENKRARERERRMKRAREKSLVRATPARVTHFCDDERGCTVEMSIKRVGQ